MQRAHTQLTDGGVIVCLDGAFYGNPGVTTITKTVIIDCKLSGGGNDLRGLLINAPAKNVRVRNLSISASYAGSPGIEIISAANVEIENVYVSDVGPSNQPAIINRSGGSKLFISNTVVETSGGSGIVVAPSNAAETVAVLENVRSHGHEYGIAVGYGGRVTVKRSIFSGNRTAGIEADPGANLEVVDSFITGNGAGVQASGTIRLRENDISSNNTAFQGAPTSLGANRIFNNGSLGSPLPVASQAPPDVYN
jgi:hypothetical protein